MVLNRIHPQVPAAMGQIGDLVAWASLTEGNISWEHARWQHADLESIRTETIGRILDPHFLVKFESGLFEEIHIPYIRNPQMRIRIFPPRDELEKADPTGDLWAYCVTNQLSAIRKLDTRSDIAGYEFVRSAVPYRKVTISHQQSVQGVVFFDSSGSVDGFAVRDQQLVSEELIIGVDGDRCPLPPTRRISMD